MFKKLVTITTITLALLLATPSPTTQHAYAGTPDEIAQTEDTVNDPIEPANRQIHKFNTLIDSILFEPIAKLYRLAIPSWGKKAVGNVLDNLKEPINTLNTALQGNDEQAITSAWRFIINSTIGLGGLLDIASEAGLEKQEEDFGQTLAVNNIESGPYIVLPIIGPTTARDLTGTVIDAFMDPFSYIFSMDASITRTATYGTHRREELIETIDDINELSFDPYATTKSLYIQRRNDEINNGKDN